MILVLLPVNKLLIAWIPDLVKINGLLRPVLLRRLLLALVADLGPPPALMTLSVPRAVIRGLIPRVLALPEPGPLAHLTAISRKGLAASASTARLLGELPSITHIFTVFFGARC